MYNTAHWTFAMRWQFTKAIHCVYVYDRQLTEVTGLSRIGSGLIDDKKSSSAEPSVFEYSLSVMLLASLLTTANTFILFFL